MLHLYDNSMINKLKEVFPNVVYAPTDKALSIATDDKKGNISLPLISVYRLSQNLDSSRSYPEAWQGRLHNRVDSANSQLFTQSLPLTLTYQIDIWSTKRIESDSIYVELLFYLIDKPNLTIDIPNITVEDFSLNITETDSDIDMESFSEKGRLYRNIITLECMARIFRHQSYDTHKYLPVIE